MKKMYYMLLMICTIGAFSACSDDDDTGDTPPENPVTGYSVPAQGEIGGEVTIKGKGYTAESKIFLKDSKGEKEMTVKTYSTVDLVFTVVPTLTAGTYSVMLHQAGGSWDLGTIALIAANPVKDFEIAEASVLVGGTVNIKGTGWADDCQIYLMDASSVPVDVENIQKTATGIQFTVPASLAAGTYTVMLQQSGDWPLGSIEVTKEAVKRLSKIEYVDSDGDGSTYELFYNTEGKLDSVYRMNNDLMKISWKFSYADAQITFSATGIDGLGEPADETIVFNLENGVVKSSTSTYEGASKTSTWTMNDKGYLTSLETEEELTTYAYDAQDRLNISEYSGNYFDVTFVYEANKIVENNLGGVDGMAFIFNSFDYPDFIPRLLGIAGKLPAWLPSGCTDESAWGAYTINYKKDGDLVSEIDLIDDTDFHYTYKFTYK